jgi:hypothetical protein
MKKIFYKGRFVFIPLGAAAFLSLISFVVMQLWNNVLPGVVHVTTINFWQAMGIFVLCKILFGFGKGGGMGAGPAWTQGRMQQRLKNMSEEERECFKEKMSGRMNCGARGWGKHWDNPQTKASEPEAGH